MSGVRDRWAWPILLMLLLACSACGTIRSVSIGFSPRIEPVSCRLSENGEFVDVRLRYHGKEPFDPDRPGSFLLDEATGEKFFLLQLQRIGKVGTTGQPDEQTVHSIMFKNRDGLLKPGARVTLVIGEHRREHLLLQK